MNLRNDSKGEGRPYRSHLHPACFSCKKRKSRCKTRNSSEVCIMCQAHGTNCVFPRPDDTYGRRLPISPRKSPANARQRHIAGDNTLHAQNSPNPHYVSQVESLGTTFPEIDRNIAVTPLDTPLMPPPSGDQHGTERLTNLAGLVTENGDSNSHIVSPAVADDNEILESYLSAVPVTRRCLVPTSPLSNRPLRPVRFNIVPRRPLGITVNQSLAALKCEVIEKYMDPDIDEYLNLLVPNRISNSSFI